ncbi:hypothetical protein [Streptomyces shenzhenensis]|uniref:hypothetical protein n=1 Tax=Streptomyces shenzhenensis TaxID=943815 RepID=UPI0033CE2E01
MPFEGFDDVSRIIVARLSKAGWKQTTRSKESEVPEFYFTNSKFHTSAFQSIEGESLMLTIVDLESQGYQRFDIQYDESLSSLLSILVKWQNKVSVRNFLDMINEIAIAVPKILAEPFSGDEDTPWEKVIPRS